MSGSTSAAIGGAVFVTFWAVVGLWAGVDLPRTALAGASEVGCFARKTSETSSPRTPLSSEINDSGSGAAIFFFVVVGFLAFTSILETVWSKVFFLGMTLLNYVLNPLQ